MKTSQFTNSSVVEQQENIKRMHTNITKTSALQSRPILKTPNRANCTRSPALSANSKKLKTTNLAVII